MAGAAEPTEPSATGGGPDLEQVAAAFPQLEILELIGRGGMGSVFKVRQPKLNRFAALKLLPRSLAADPAFAGRFEREAQVLARLSHPNIVAVYDYGQADGFFYLLMEFVDGVNLRQAMRAARFTPEQALAIVPKICEALQFAHDEGVLHRDIKPENLLLDSRGRVKLADFGIAKLAAEAEVAGIEDGQQDPLFTQSGTALGTPSYMAPEQRDRPSEVDHRADIYSLGVVFYEMLTGELPGPDFVAPSANSSADSRVDDIVKQALQHEPSWRQRSAGQMRTQVEAVTGPTPEERGGMQAAREIFSRAAIVFSVVGTWKQWEIVAPESEAAVPVSVTGIGLGEPWLTEHRWMAAEPGQALGEVGGVAISPAPWLLSEVAMVLAAICWALWFFLKREAGERLDSLLDGRIRPRSGPWKDWLDPLIAGFGTLGTAIASTGLWLGAAPFCLWLVFALVGLTMAFAAPQGSTSSILSVSLAQLHSMAWGSAALWSLACAARRRWGMPNPMRPAPGPWPARLVGTLCGIILIAFAVKTGFFEDEIAFFKNLF
jgi:tRNA A-37 threonylcarbamoyl transferase component Bud32